MDIWIQILLISLALSIFSQFLNKIMKLDSKNVKALQTRLRELSQEMDAARYGSGVNVQGIKPTRSLEEVNGEIRLLMKRMMKEQFLPMCVRCGIFWGIFAILAAIYGQYSEGVLFFTFPLFGSGWMGAYVFFSLVIGLSIFGLKKLYQWITHKFQPITPDATTLINLPKLLWKSRLEAAKRIPPTESNDSESTPPL
ncbi:MAG: hypothetical protein RBG13Loki_2018 [Promethearchaeota archaeon CR_4]|nr:MAG: hypothetical protein RBG13Loki_2018 [Candidatus Lokiarchaeota archaeon CR_4]